LGFIKKIIACLQLLFSLSFIARSQPHNSFSRISDELVNNEVTAVIQDRHGFIWFGTRGGLQRYDGYEMNLLKNEHEKNNNLLGQSIEVLKNGRNKNIWIGTKSGGLSEYNFETGRVRNYINNSQVSGFNSDYILSILDTDSEKLFVGTWKGFAYLDKITGRFHILNAKWKTFDIQPDGSGGYWLGTNGGLKHFNRQLVNDQSYNFGVQNLNVSSIAADPAHHCLWLGTWAEGLFQFDLLTKTVKNYRHNAADPKSISANNTYRTFVDTRGSVFVGTWGAGLNLMDREAGTFSKVNLNIPGLYTNDNQIILTMQEDASGLLWVGTDGAGVFKLDLNQKKFSNIGYEDQKSSLIGSTHVLSVFVDPYNKLWVGTKGGGIQYSTNWKDFTPIGLQTGGISAGSPTSCESRCFIQDGDSLWIGTNKGLIRAVNRRNSVSHLDVFTPDSANMHSLSGKKINAIVRGADGRLWIGTQENGLSCLTGYDSKTRPVFKNYLPAYGVKGALQNERVSSLLVDSKKRLWIGTYKGLHLYDPGSDKFQVFSQSDDRAKSLSNNTILCITEDPLGNIWVGTQYGLNKITGISNKDLIVTGYTMKQGMPSDYITAVEADAKGNIWASTNKGLARIRQSTNSIAVFDKRDGVQSAVFSENASFKCSDNKLLFGGLEGLTYFEADSIRINKFSPPVYFTNLSINNVPYRFAPNDSAGAVLTKPFSETQSIVLDYKKNIFSIEFAALDYHAPDKNEYMYQLQGFNDNWVYAGKNRLVSFTNLEPGTYFLKVKATNSDKIWKEEPQVLKIEILPPPWKTWWAFSLYIALFIVLLWLTRYLGLRQAALKNQLAFTKLARQQENELADFKERLFTNISHEFRTPLTLILGPIDDLLHRSNVDKAVSKSLRLIQKQSKRMLRMVNQLLDFQKAEAGSLTLSPQPGEMVSFCRDIFILFADEAQRRNINYSFHPAVKYFSFVFDPNKLEIIIFNILSNAFKFTPNEGSISMQIATADDGACMISISDTGRGIPSEELERVFDRFYRGKETDATNISGTGIGLSFVKELTELHGGTIRAESVGANGTCFTVSLPARPAINGLSAVNEEYISQQHTSQLKSSAMQEENESINGAAELPIILLVEDEADMMQYIYEILSPNFNLVTAENGKKGVECALETIPDLIVSDIMMPEMDGYELCRKLKSDKSTSHIPIILLTALTDMSHHVEGIREGADVFLPKPFNSQLLLVHIRNLINSRNTLKELYAKKIFLGSGNFEIKSYEEEFLYKLVKVVEDNISNPNFNNDELAGHMFMSKSTFYRKLKAMTGMSGNEFIRTARLNYAAKLLDSGKYSVTEATFESGFNDIKYFRKRFQEHFQVTPSAYKK
jgi:signal transduction histidine kinase/ligand-binding sensor domain-containing protein/CheY-like chemotaxis protein/AraC-like DNA-binding protein